MKIFKVLFVAIIALGMTACNNDDVPDMTGEKDATISIKVFPASNGTTVRATGDLTAPGVEPAGLAAESAVKSLEVWIFQGDVLDAYKSAAGNEVTDIAAHIGARDVIVVANAEIGQKNSKDELLATLKGLPADIASKGLIMTAEPFNITLEKGKNYYGYTGTDIAGEEKYHTSTPLAITRVNARVAIVSAVLDYTNVPANQQVVFDELKDVEVAMYNVPEQTKLFGTDLATNADYLFGAKWPSPENTYVGADDATATPTASLTNNVTDALPVVITNAPYYYVNESNGTDEMFIVLRAKLYKDEEPVLTVKDLYTDADGYTYYPVWVNATKEGYSYTGDNTGDGIIRRNTQYNISLTIKGLGNPTIDEVEKAWLDVAVEVKPWKVVNQTVVW